MKKEKPAYLKKTVLILAAFAVVSMIPNSFADELLQTITETITQTISDPAPPEPAKEPVAEPATTGEEAAVEPSPSPAPSDLIPEESTPSASPSATPSESGEPSPSPSPTPKPPHALENQSMRIIAPSEVNVDPRARSVYLPRIYVASGGNLLVCASSNLASFDANTPNISSGQPKSSLEISGANSPYLRISGIGLQAAGIINSGNGLRVFSPNRALAGSYIQLRFVALSEVSANPKLCGDGSASNTRTIYLRALGIDLNIIKGGVTLK